MTEAQDKTFFFSFYGYFALVLQCILCILKGNCRNLGFLNGFRWKMKSGEGKCSSSHWLAAETWQAVNNLMDCLHIVNHRGPEVLCFLQKRVLKPSK